MLLTLKTQIKNLKKPHSFNTTVIITVYLKENGNNKKKSMYYTMLCREILLDFIKYHEISWNPKDLGPIC